MSTVRILNAIKGNLKFIFCFYFNDFNLNDMIVEDM